MKARVVWKARFSSKHNELCSGPAGNTTVTTVGWGTAAVCHGDLPRCGDVPSSHSICAWRLPSPQLAQILGHNRALKVQDVVETEGLEDWPIDGTHSASRLQSGRVFRALSELVLEAKLDLSGCMMCCSRPGLKSALNACAARSPDSRNHSRLK